MTVSLPCCSYISARESSAVHHHYHDLMQIDALKVTFKWSEIILVNYSYGTKNTLFNTRLLITCHLVCEGPISGNNFLIIWLLIVIRVILVKKWWQLSSGIGYSQGYCTDNFLSQDFQNWLSDITKFSYFTTYLMWKIVFLLIQVMDLVRWYTLTSVSLH